MAKINICMMTAAHPIFDPRIFHRECKTLVENGYNVTLIAQHDKDTVVDNIKIISLPITKNRYRRMAWLPILAFVRGIKEKANIYHFHDPELIPIGILLKLFIRRKVICDIHENVPKQILTKEWIPAGVLRYLIGRTASWMLKIAAHLFDYVITAGAEIADENFAGFSRIDVIRNLPTSAFINSFQVNNPKEDIAIYVGTIARERAIKEMIEAMHYTKSAAKLNILGSFSDTKLEEEMKKLANNNINFFPKVNHKEVPGYLSKAKIGILCLYPIPNYIGAMGGINKIYEYMAAGLALVASNFPKWKEFVEGRGFGITVDPKNPREIAKAIDHLLDNPDILESMAIKGRKAVENEYNWDIEKNKLLEIYKILSK